MILQKRSTLLNKDQFTFERFDDCEVLYNEYTNLLLHMKICLLNRGRVLNRVFELKDK